MKWILFKWINFDSFSRKYLLWQRKIAKIILKVQRDGLNEQMIISNMQITRYSCTLGGPFLWHLFALHLMSIFENDSFLFDDDRFDVWFEKWLRGDIGGWSREKINVQASRRYVNAFAWRGCKRQNEHIHTDAICIFAMHKAVPRCRNANAIFSLWICTER